MKYPMKKTPFAFFFAAMLAIAGCDSSLDAGCDPRNDPTAKANTGTIEVAVKDFHTGEPIRDAEVAVMPGDHTGTTAKDGTATFTGITSYRNYKAEVSHQDHSAEDNYGLGRTGFIRVETGQTTTVTVPLKKSSVVHGTVTANGAPVSDAFVVLSRMQTTQTSAGAGQGFKQVALVVTDADGRYRFDRLSDGSYKIRALADSHYMAEEDLVLDTDQILEQDFALTPGTTSLSFTIGADGTQYYGDSKSVDVKPSVFATTYAESYLTIIDVPQGGDVLPGEFDYQFIGTVPGDYIAIMMLVDLNGVCKPSPPTAITLHNHPTEAYPTVIPGPSVLPMLDSCTPFTETAGTLTVRPNENVYLRGWGRDYNLASPETCNSAAPMFDIYGNKNGDWNQSDFSFSWRLRDGDDADRSGLLSSKGSQNVHFKVPANAADGDTFTAILTVSGDYDLAGSPGEVSVVVAHTVGNERCASCHSDEHTTYGDTAHSRFAVNCEDCHGPGSQHQTSAANITKPNWPGNCGRCHLQFAEWQRSRHSDPLAFGHAEINPNLLGNCYTCHYAEGFIAAVETPGGFHDYTFIGPSEEIVPKDTPNVGCNVCHDPHVQPDDNPTGIRTGSGENLCDTCHEKKWQNATYTGKGDEIENAFHFADYTQYQGEGNQHLMPNGCASCHMARDITESDDMDVRRVGAHTMRMREAGLDGVLGTEDDLLNIGVCQSCHRGLKTFDRNGVMTRIKNKLDTLEALLQESNHQYLPPFQPGKCATCHKGGTLPFVHETEGEILDKAYLNYKLILHDRSFGIHNPGYIERLLDDSIAAIQDAEI